MLVGVQLLQMCEQPQGLKQYCIIYLKNCVKKKKKVQNQFPSYPKIIKLGMMLIVLSTLAMD